jgi:hypothetical protein
MKEGLTDSRQQRELLRIAGDVDSVLDRFRGIRKDVDRDLAYGDRIKAVLTRNELLCIKLIGLWRKSPKQHLQFDYRANVLHSFELFAHFQVSVLLLEDAGLDARNCKAEQRGLLHRTLDMEQCLSSQQTQLLVHERSGQHPDDERQNRDPTQDCSYNHSDVLPRYRDVY